MFITKIGFDLHWFSRHLALAMLPLLVGCGPSSGKVTGRVLLDGTPLPGGRVTFRPANPAENSVSVELNEQGQFEAMLPIGEVLVSVDNREFQPRPPRGAIALPALSPELQSKIATEAPQATPTPNVRSGRYVPISSRYYNAETAGLGFTVKGGDQLRDIELTK